MIKVTVEMLYRLVPAMDIAQLAQVGALIPTMLRSASERHSLLAGGQFSAVFCVINVEVPLQVISASLEGALRLGEMILPVSVGFNEAAACPVK